MQKSDEDSAGLSEATYSSTSNGCRCVVSDRPTPRLLAGSFRVKLALKVA